MDVNEFVQENWKTQSCRHHICMLKEIGAKQKHDLSSLSSSWKDILLCDTLPSHIVSGNCKSKVSN
jgi:hypothetical protein